MGAWEEDRDADKEGEKEVLHVDPLQLVAHILAPLQKDRRITIPKVIGNWYGLTNCQKLEKQKDTVRDL